jgi:hypothetical protein
MQESQINSLNEDDLMNLAQLRALAEESADAT